MNISQLNRLSRNVNPYGSPFFNYSVDVVVSPLNRQDIAILLKRAQDLTGVTFDDRDYAYLLTAGGCHPYCFQVAGAALFDAKSEGLTGGKRYELANDVFHDHILQHFDDVWENLEDNARTVAVMLALVELGGKAVCKTFSFGEIERVKAFGPELRKLSKDGLAEKVSEGWQFDFEHLLLWQGERWRLSSLGFVWWISDVAIAGTRRVPKYTEWLEAKRYEGLLTHEQWTTLKGLATKVPGGAATLMRSFVTELLKLRLPKK